MKRKKYSQGSLSTHKSIGDLDLSLSGIASGGGSHSKRNYNAQATITAQKGNFKLTHISGLGRLKDRVSDSKFNYKDSEISYTHTTKSGAKITASAGKNRAGLSIFKELK